MQGDATGCIMVVLSGGGVSVDLKVQLLHRNVQRFRGGLVFKAHRLCVSLNSRLGCNKEEDEAVGGGRLRRPEGV